MDDGQHKELMVTPVVAAELYLLHWAHRQGESYAPPQHTHVT